LCYNISINRAFGAGAELPRPGAAAPSPPPVTGQERAKGKKTFNNYIIKRPGAEPAAAAVSEAPARRAGGGFCTSPDPHPLTSELPTSKGSPILVPPPCFAGRGGASPPCFAGWGGLALGGWGEKTGEGEPVGV